MSRVVKYIVWISILFAALPTEAQFIDTVCTNTPGRGYHVFGLPGSTYTWTVTGGTPAPVSVDDTIFVNWGSVPGVYVLTVMERTIDGCDGPLVSGNVKVVNNPVVFAGNAASVCSNSTLLLSSSDSSFAIRVAWKTSGDGTFDDTTILHPVYTPGPLDVFAGTVNLTLTGYSLALSCPPSTSVVVITIVRPVIASAGPDVSACALTPITILGATATNFSSLLWTYNGLGTLNNPAILNPTYTPAPGELGNVTFTLHAYSNLPCVDSVIDQMIMTIYPLPTGRLSLLTRDTICGGDTVRLRADLTGTPPWTMTFNDGIKDSIITINSTPYFIILFPDSSRTYTIAALTDIHCAALPATLIDSIHLLVHPKPGAEFTWNSGFQNNVIHFHLDSTVVDTTMIGFMVQWNFGDGTFGYGHDPVHTYPASNTFHVTMSVTDTFGCHNSVTHDVVIPPIPIAFYSSNSPTCLGTPMCFQDLSTVPSPPAGFIQTWIWNFGDGTPQDTIQFPNNPNICHTYAATGNYAVSLTIVDNLGANSTYVHGQTVLPTPVAAFIYSSNCQNQPVQFTDVSTQNGGGGLISWSWNFGDPASGVNNTSILQNPAHLFSGSGKSYNVTLSIQNVNGCRDTLIKTVYILGKPTVEFTHDSACDDQVVHFAADPVITHYDSIVSWSWDFGDGSSPVTNPVTATHTYTAPGTYVTTLTVVDHHGCINSVSHGIRVNPLPFALFSWSSPTCSGSPVHFTDNSTVPSGYTGFIAKWLWDFGDGNTQLITLPASPNVTHTFVGNGLTHTVRLTVWTSDSCSQFIEHVINSIPGPTADFNTSAIHCTSSPVQFTDASQTNSGGSISQWQWNFDDPLSGINNTSALQNPLHTYLSSGTYHVSLIVTNLTGCTDTVIKTLDINVAPLADFHADTACLNSVTQFMDLSSPNGGTIITRTWDFGDGTALSHLQNPTHTYSLSGVFNVRLTVVNSNGCTKDTIKAVLVNPLPLAAFSYTTPNCLGAVVHYTNLSTTPPGYLGSIVQWVWDFGDGTSATIHAPANPDVSHTFAGTALTHVVRLTVTTSDGCSGYIEHTINSIPSPIANFGFPSLNCNAQAVQFSDLTNTNGGGAIVSWNWNFGDPVSGLNNISNLQNPAHLFSGPGVYNVSLIIANANSCTDTVLKTITISLSPMADFTADTACLNQPTQFSDHSTANASSIIGWVWDFGDGTPPSSLQNPTHLYSSYGVKNVKLTITNSNGCKNDITKAVLVRPLPVAAFTFSNNNCHGSAVQFTDGSTTVAGYLGSIVQWVWDFGDGTPPVTILAPNNPNVTHIYTGTANAYIVRLTVTTSDGCSAFAEHTVNILAGPTAEFTYPSGSCAQQPLQFTDASQTNGGGPITQWNWNFGDPVSGLNNTSALQNPMHPFSAPGIYTVTEIITSAANCTSTVTHTLTITPAPVANFTADTACLGFQTTFTVQTNESGGTIIQYFWDFGDGSTSNLKNPVHTYPNAGLFQVRLTIMAQNGCNSDTTKSVLVVPAPVAAFIASGPTCEDSIVHFTDNSTASYGTIHSWVWQFGDGTSTSVIYPASPNVNHTYTYGGTFSVVLTITTLNGCSASVIHSVVIQPAPAAGFVYSSNSCQLSPVQFTDMSQGNGGTPVTQWLWNFGDPGSGNSNISNLQNPVHTFSATGVYNVRLTITSAAGCVNSTTKPVNISTGPVAEFSSDTACAGNATQFADHSIPNAGSIVSWHWDFGDPSSGPNNTSTLQNPSHIYSYSGNYQVRLTVINSNLCEKDTLMTVPVPSKPVAMFRSAPACAKSPTQFTDLSNSQNSIITAWFWDFGDGSGTSNIQNPQYTYTTAGTYNVKLRVTNNFSCSDSVIIPVSSYPLPAAAFVYNSFFCPAGQVAFTDQSNGNGSQITDRLWIFQSGSTSSLPDPTYVFPVTDTTYQVTLIITNANGCKDTTIENVYVEPVYSLTFSYDTVCLKGATHFHAHNKAQGDSLYFIQWNFGDPASGVNNTSTLHDAVHVFSSQGTFVVKLRARDSDNCTDSVLKTVIVNPLPVPDYSFVSPPCDSITVFTDKSLAGSGTIASWKWDFGDGSTPQTIVAPASGNTTHFFNAPGKYRVSLTVTNANGCSDTISHLVDRPSCISADFTENQGLICTNSPVFFTDNSSPSGQITSWFWTFGDRLDTTYTAYAHTIRHTYVSGGKYKVLLTIRTTIAGITYTDTASSVITVNPTPDAEFMADPVCLNKITLFEDKSNNFGEEVASLNWNFGDPGSGINNTSSLSDPSHKYNKAGRYTVSLIVVNKAGCKDSAVRPENVHNLPSARFINTMACSGNPTYFFDQSVVIDTSIQKWNWNFGVPKTGKDTSELRDPVFRYKKEGNYQVSLVVQDYNGCYDTVDSTIRVEATPLSAFIIYDNINNMTGKIQLRNKSEGAENYFWDFGNGSTSTDDNPYVTYTHDGTYTIMLVSSNHFGCADTTFLKYDVLFKGLFVPNAFAPSSVAQGVQEFKPVGVNLKEYKVQVFDSWGHLIWQSTALDSEGRPVEGWNGVTSNGDIMPQGTYVWVINAVFNDGTTWTGSDVGKGDGKTFGTVTLIR
jgi:PKD repeat protein